MIDQLIHILIQSSWQILILSLIVWPLSRLSIRAYPNFAYILWVVILVKALIPINITLPSQQIPVVLLSPVITGGFIQETTVSSTTSISIYAILVTLWVLGVLFLGMKLFLSEYTHRKRMRTAQELTPETWFGDMKTDLGLKRHIRLYASENIQSPLMQGLWNVRIYLPRDYPSWTLDEKQSVLAHELTHVRRLDILVIYLQAIVKTLYFFHPVIWLLNDQIDLEREKICDDEAIELSRADRGAYGEQLFKQLSSEQGERSVPVLAGGFFMSDSSIIKRFRYIKEKRGDMQGRLKVYHMLLILVVISLAVIIACSQKIEKASITSTAMDNTSGRIVLNGIIYDRDKPDKPFAIINGEIYGVGDQIGGHTLIEISDDIVTLEKAGETIHLDYQKVQEPDEVPPPLNDNVVFQEFDVPPQPVGGYAAVQKNVVYPELARNAGIGGTTIIQVAIDEQGVSGNTIILKSAGDASLDAAAIVAVKRTSWVPAQDQGEPVSVRISMPIVFTLKTGDKEKSVTSAKPVGSQTWDESPRPSDWKAISNNIVYPESARKAGESGTLTMRFTIDERGNLIDPHAVAGPKSEALKKAAVFALTSTKWIPAIKDGNPVSATMEMGIGFGSEDEQNKTQNIANGLRPLDRIGKVPVTIKGPNAEAKASDVWYKIYINSDGIFESINGSISTTDEDVIVDSKALDRWMRSKWEAVPKEDKLEGQWIEVPLEFTFID